MLLALGKTSREITVFDGADEWTADSAGASLHSPGQRGELLGGMSFITTLSAAYDEPGKNGACLSVQGGHSRVTGCSFIFIFTGRQLTAPWVRQKFLTSYNPPTAHGASRSRGGGGSAGEGEEPPVDDIENVQGSSSSCSSGGCSAREAMRRREALASNEESEPGLYSPSLCAWYENFDRYFAPQFFPAGKSPPWKKESCTAVSSLYRFSLFLSMGLWSF